MVMSNWAALKASAIFSAVVMSTTSSRKRKPTIDRKRNYFITRLLRRQEKFPSNVAKSFSIDYNFVEKKVVDVGHVDFLKISYLPKTRRESTLAVGMKRREIILAFLHLF